MVADLIVNNHSYRPEAEWLFFYLLDIITNAIIKAIAMIVIPTNPKNNKCIMFNNTSVSIAPPHLLTDFSVYVRWQPTPLIPFSVIDTIQ